MKKVIYLVLICLLFQSTSSSYAEDDSKKVLLIYSTEANEVTSQVRILDALVGHFTTNITIKSDEDITEELFKENYTHIVYFGEKEKQLSKQLIQSIETFPGSVMWLGRNSEQAKNSFSFVQVEGERVAKAFQMKNKELQESGESILVMNITQSTDATVLVESEGVPLVVQKNNRMYGATLSLFDPVGKFIGESLFIFFEQSPSTGKKKAYLRLEDIHPASEPEKLKEIATLLKERNIPYMVVVIPVYTNPETNETKHFSDAKEVVKVLQYMQDNGGSIILHGYNHQYRQQETAEGFEFWDVENNSPIYQGADGVYKTREDFSTEEEYKAHIEEGKKFERKYIEERVVNGVTELVSHELYPLAFEAPHYTMSQAGYEVLSNYFSTYVGQVQISDTDWKTMYKPPYVSTPSFLHGMKLLPETIGFVDPNKIEEDINRMSEQALAYTKVSDGMVGGFYHPYLGVGLLRQLVDKLETIPNMEWLDLKEEKNTVSVPNINISTDGKTGEVNVDKTPTNLYEWLFHYRMYAPVFIVLVIGIGVGITMYRNRRKRSI
jgi:uncharacterized protein YdaL